MHGHLINIYLSHLTDDNFHEGRNYLFVVAVQSLSPVQLFATPQTTADQVPMSSLVQHYIF